MRVLKVDLDAICVDFFNCVGSAWMILFNFETVTCCVIYKLSADKLACVFFFNNEDKKLN